MAAVVAAAAPVGGAGLRPFKSLDVEDKQLCSEPSVSLFGTEEPIQMVTNLARVLSRDAVVLVRQ